MKKLLALFMAVFLLMMLCACSVKNLPDFSSDGKKTNETSSVSGSKEWEEFVKEYEAIVDKFVEVSKKYKENPTDKDLVNEYKKLAGEAKEWGERAEEWKKDLSPKEAIKFAAAILKVTKKLKDIAG